MLNRFDIGTASHGALTAPAQAARTFIVANRLPIEYHAVFGWRTSPGGLVSALEPALQGMSAEWVGWRGSPAPEDGRGPHPTGTPYAGNIAVAEIPMSQWEVSHFYDGICNAAFWPLYHHALVRPVFRDAEFEVYRRINQRFADSVAARAPSGAAVWVHDYQLQLVPAMLRRVRPDLRIGFFLHVPFPASPEFATLPWKESILDGLLGADLIGFQTPASAEHFLAEACRWLPARRSGMDLLLQAPAGPRRVRVGVFPVGPDAGRFAQLAATPALQAAAARIRADFGSPQQILLGVDRLDYTKGIDIRIRAVADLLLSDEFAGRDIQYIQVAVPSRSELVAYRQLRVTVDEALRVANATLAARGLRPIHYVNEVLPTEQVAALYVAADVMLVTSLADGMNLVSKEFVACRNRVDGRLVLSSAAGAATQLPDAWLVDPRDAADLRRGIGAAMRAGPENARKRMERLREAVFAADARQWAQSFLACLHEDP